MLLPLSNACTFSLYSHIFPLFLITLCLWSQTCLSNQHWLPLLLIKPIRGAFWLANQTQHAASECSFASTQRRARDAQVLPVEHDTQNKQQTNVFTAKTLMNTWRFRQVRWLTSEGKGQLSHSISSRDDLFSESCSGSKLGSSFYLQIIIFLMNNSALSHLQIHAKHCKSSASSHMHINEWAWLFRSHQRLLLKYECVPAHGSLFKRSVFNRNHYSRHTESGRSFLSFETASIN